MPLFKRGRGGPATADALLPASGGSGGRTTIAGGLLVVPSSKQKLQPVPDAHRLSLQQDDDFAAQDVVHPDSRDQQQHQQPLKQQDIRAASSGSATEISQPSTASAVGEANKGPGSEDDGIFLHEQELLAGSSFPVAPEQLIAWAKEVLAAGVSKCGRLAPDFTFTAPFIGPLNAKDFAGVMDTLSLDSVFPDLKPRIYHLRVDPLQPNRVWFTTRPIGTHKGYLRAKLPIPMAPTGKVVELPPQTSSLTFNEDGQVTDHTMGYVMDRRIGNSGGLGGAFGLLYAIGAPFPYPEGKPWESSWQQRVFNSGNPLLQAAMFVYDRVTSALLPNWLITQHSRNLQ